MYSKFENGNLITKVEMKGIDFTKLKASKSGKSYIVFTDREDVNIDGMTMKLSVMAYIPKEVYEDRFLDATLETPTDTNNTPSLESKMAQMETAMAAILQAVTAKK